MRFKKVIREEEIKMDDEQSWRPQPYEIADEMLATILRIPIL